MESIKTKSAVLQMMRGIAIVIVIFRHAIAQMNTDIVLDDIEQIIICFHMPLFFVISGYLYQEKISKYLALGKVNFIVRKGRHLLVPYTFWTVILWIGVQVACNIEKVKGLMATIGFGSMGVKQLLFGMLTYENYYTEHLWFLYVLFIYFVISICMGNHGDSCIFFAFALGMGLLNNFISMPYIIGKCFTWFAFFVGGRVLAANKKLLNCVKKIDDIKAFVLVCLAFLICSMLRLMAVNFEINVLARFILKNMVGFLGVWLVYGIAIRIVTVSYTHLRVRLATKPGITGMWQVSGRSDITDFEEVVKLDKAYITGWSIGLDVRILLKTVGVVVLRRGAM